MDFRQTREHDVYARDVGENIDEKKEKSIVSLGTLFLKGWRWKEDKQRKRRKRNLYPGSHRRRQLWLFAVALLVRWGNEQNSAVIELGFGVFRSFGLLGLVVVSAIELDEHEHEHAFMGESASFQKFPSRTEADFVGKMNKEEDTEANMYARDYVASHLPPPGVSRIIGGKITSQGRYPYMVSIRFSVQNVCGGSLIGPDLVLSSAHCLASNFGGIQVGRYDITNRLARFEKFVVEDIAIHPSYKPEAKLDQKILDFKYDFMIVKLYGMSSYKYVKLNSDPYLPSRVGQPLTVLGWGDIDPDHHAQDLADKLREVELKYVTNEQCAKSNGTLHGKSYSYQGLITDASLCAADKDQDACQGDSGGPLLVKGNNADSDVQVGIVSWGLGCAHPSFPGVYARVSDQISWIKQESCRLSDAPPSSFQCQNRPLPIPPTYTKELLTIQIKFDTFPGELGWLIRSVPDRKIYAYTPIGSYKDKNEKGDVIEETVRVDYQRDYQFVVMDEFGDGQSYAGTKGYHRLYQGPSESGVMLVSGGGDFGHSQRYDFSLVDISSSPTVQPSSVPSDSPVVVPSAIPSRIPTVPPHTVVPSSEPTTFPTIERESLRLSLLIKFDMFPEEVGWTLTSVDDQSTVMSVPVNAYKGKQYGIIMEQMYLDKLKHGTRYQYAFSILDSGKNGLCCGHGSGYYRLYLENGALLLSGDSFRDEEQFTLTISFFASDAPSLVPTITATPSSAPTKDAKVLVLNSSYAHSSTAGDAGLNERPSIAPSVQKVDDVFSSPHLLDRREQNTELSSSASRCQLQLLCLTLAFLTAGFIVH